MVTARMIQVIEASGVRGVGTEDDPHRTVTAYFTPDGTLLAESDPVKDTRMASIHVACLRHGCTLAVDKGER